MTRGTHFGSIAFRVVLFFALNPEEELTTRDVKAKFGEVSYGVRSAMRRAILSGYILAENAGKGTRVTLKAGPALLVAIGRVRA